MAEPANLAELLARAIPKPPTSVDLPSSTELEVCPKCNNRWRYKNPNWNHKTYYDYTLECDCVGAVAYREKEAERRALEEEEKRQAKEAWDAKCPTCGGHGIVPRFPGDLCSERMCSCKYGAEWNILAADGTDLIPPRFQAARLTDVSRELVRTAEKIDREQGTGLLIYGAVGSGKTHYAAACVYHLLETVPYKSIMFITMPDLLDRIRTSYKSSEKDETLENALSVSVLVIDDLGKEKISDWVLEKVYQIINRRYNYQLSTVVTTNKTPSQLARHIGEAATSRLLEMCERVKISGQDRRTVKAGIGDETA